LVSLTDIFAHRLLDGGTLKAEITKQILIFAVGLRFTGRLKVIAAAQQEPRLKRRIECCLLTARMFSENLLLNKNTKHRFRDFCEDRTDLRARPSVNSRAGGRSPAITGRL